MIAELNYPIETLRGILFGLLAMYRSFNLNNISKNCH